MRVLRQNSRMSVVMKGKDWNIQTKKKVPVSHCSPQTTNGLVRNWTQASSTRCRRISTCAVTRIGQKRNRKKRSSVCILQHKNAVNFVCVCVCVCACVHKPSFSTGRVVMLTASALANTIIVNVQPKNSCPVTNETRSVHVPVQTSNDFVPIC